MVFGRSNYQKLPANKLIKGVPYKKGDLVFALNKKAKIYWPAKVVEVEQKKCRIEFFATKETAWRKTKKIFPYSENKKNVKNHDTEALFYKAWKDVDCEANTCQDSCGANSCHDYTPARRHDNYHYPTRGKPDKRFKKCAEKLSDDYWNATRCYEKSDLSETSNESRKSCEYWTTKLQVDKRKVPKKCGCDSCCDSCCSCDCSDNCSDDCPSEDLLSACQVHWAPSDHHHGHHGHHGGHHGGKGGGHSSKKGKGGGKNSKKSGKQKGKSGGKSTKKGGGGGGHHGHHKKHRHGLGHCSEGSSEDRLACLPADNNQQSCSQSCCNQQSCSTVGRPPTCNVRQPQSCNVGQPQSCNVGQQCNPSRSYNRRFRRSYQCTESWPKCYNGPNYIGSPEKDFYNKPMSPHTDIVFPGCRPSSLRNSGKENTAKGCRSALKGSEIVKTAREKEKVLVKKSSRKNNKKRSKKKKAEKEAEESVFCDAIAGLMDLMLDE